MMTLILNVLGVLCTSSSSPVCQSRSMQRAAYNTLGFFSVPLILSKIKVNGTFQPKHQDFCMMSCIQSFIHWETWRFTLSLGVLKTVPVCLTFCSLSSCQQQNLMSLWFMTLPFYAYLCVCVCVCVISMCTCLSLVCLLVVHALTLYQSLWNRYLYIHTAPYICIYIYTWQHFGCCCCASRLRQIGSIDTFKWDLNLI